MIRCEVGRERQTKPVRRRTKRGWPDHFTCSAIDEPRAEYARHDDHGPLARARLCRHEDARQIRRAARAATEKESAERRVQNDECKNDRAALLIHHSPLCTHHFPYHPTCD